MTTMINPHPNGRKRPSLGEQINRLDSMLEGLSEGLNDAVADAVKVAVGAAVKEAVQTALKEVMTNPEVLSKIHASSVKAASAKTAPTASAKTAPTASAAAKPPEPQLPRLGWWQRASRFIGGVCRQSVEKVRSSAAFLWQQTSQRLQTLWSYADVIRQFKYQILGALAIGMLIRAGVWCMQQWIVALMNRIGEFSAELAAQAAEWLRNVLTASFQSAA